MGALDAIRSFELFDQTQVRSLIDFLTLQVVRIFEVILQAQLELYERFPQLSVFDSIVHLIRMVIDERNTEYYDLLLEFIQEKPQSLARRALPVRWQAELSRRRLLRRAQLASGWRRDRSASIAPGCRARGMGQLRRSTQTIASGRETSSRGWSRCIAWWRFRRGKEYRSQMPPAQG